MSQIKYHEGVQGVKQDVKEMVSGRMKSEQLIFPSIKNVKKRTVIGVVERRVSLLQMRLEKNIFGMTEMGNVFIISDENQIIM